MPRLFTGLEIPSDIGFSLSLKRGGVPGARWIDPANYHITLRYIGDVDHRTADEVDDILARFAYAEPFALTIDHLGVFGGNKPRALYAGLAPSEALNRLQASHERMLQRVGLVPDGRKFVPHVTLARLKDTQPEDLAHHLSQTGRFPPLSFTVEHFVLFSSKESVGGGPYVVEQDYPLAA
ncbi:RNA 2',3'-cyclic phosphodiesterase [Pelagibacterium xiamenense]|uniref:RNA 2',3'-cyclic phosphodiesterase n=1 Tax=Pelagibacterium xiamenense TaxID=2901140 RepID=UPI001E383E61|nr:RNA 2',3'-cyclic phosphodiesterase [Pelagibacterium xiamenense]MCD7058369.1 RNA 2',3'-cyclic phosphodiesterase [Pelagibacterium xiamenense]